MDPITIARLIEYFDLKKFFEDNPPLRLIIILCVMAVMAAIARFVCLLLQRKLEKLAASRYQLKDKTLEAAGAKFMDAMDFTQFEKVIRNTKRVLYLMVLYWGTDQIILGPLYEDIIRILFTTLCILASIEFFTAFVPFNIDLYLRRRGSTLGKSQTRSLLPIVKGVIWAVGLTFLLDNVGLHVSTIIAGLGIVGVAVGLAGQAILADFFSYIVLLVDKPFLIGDFVILTNGKSGAVEYMGPKTTHLRSLDDDLIICANSEMTKGTLVNQGSIHERVVISEIGVDYGTPPETLKKLPDILREVVNAFPQCGFDRACLLEFGNSSLNIQLIYLVSEQRGGLRDFMNTRSQVNIAILERFAQEGINIPFPTEHVLLSDMATARPAPARRSVTSASVSAFSNNGGPRNVPAAEANPGNDNN